MFLQHNTIVGIYKGNEIKEWRDKQIRTTKVLYQTMYNDKAYTSVIPLVDYCRSDYLNKALEKAKQGCLVQVVYDVSAKENDKGFTNITLSLKLLNVLETGQDIEVDDVDPF